MVVLAKGELEQIALPAVQKAAPPLADVPEVDLAAGRAAAARAVVTACEEHGFFKVTGHGVPAALLARVEAAAAAFFALPQREKEAATAASPGGPFGYASKRIGSNGDLGWVEYLLLGVTTAGAAPVALPGLPLPVSGEVPPAPPCSFRNVYACGAHVRMSSYHGLGARQSHLSHTGIVESGFSVLGARELLNEYIVAVRRLTCEVLELIAEGLGMEEKDVFTRLVLDKESDSMLRVNHYPPRPELKQLGHGRLIGFGEHTDPQIISVLRSNDTSGLEISLRDDRWVSVPQDQNSFFVNVGDALQVLTNGRFRSVRHRVMVNSVRSRVSVIFFGGPPPREMLAPLSWLVGEGGRSRYREFTWREYKASACRTKLAENRLCHFETSS